MKFFQIKKIIDKKNIFHQDYNLKNFFTKETKFFDKILIKKEGRILYYYKK